MSPDYRRDFYSIDSTIYRLRRVAAPAIFRAWSGRGGRGRRGHRMSVHREQERNVNAA